MKPFKPKILIVDDRKENLIALSHLLKPIDTELLLAKSGREALSLVLQHEFAIILLDVQMPEMDGFEFADLIRGNKKTKGIPIIFITASNKEEKHVLKGYKYGAIDYIFKPVEPTILISKVKLFLEIFNKNKALKEMMLVIKKKEINLEESNQELENFASVVSHDLKEPLRKIIFYGSQIKEASSNSLDKTMQNKLLSVLDAGKRMQLLINGLLKIARITTKESKFERIDTTKEMKSVISDLQEKIDVHKGRVEFHNLPIIYGDSVQVRQLFQNLIDNSIKYKRKNVSPIIRIQGIKKDDLSAEIIFSDNGLGFNTDELAIMLTPYERLKSSLHRKGFGIGLATVKKIMDRHKGSIKALGVPGKGSKFIINFPKNNNSNVLPATPNYVPGFPLTHVYNNSIATILVAEDVPKFQSLFSNFLQEGKYSFTIAPNGKEALELYKKNHFDLILMDSDMPIMDGFSTAEKIRKWEEKTTKNKTPIVSVSQLIMPDDKELYLGVGINDCLEKPFTFENLDKKIKKWIKKTK
ncbi:response regulator [bacterium]|jgi:two-component system, sensor histidine kinase and response regulator|nr:response regulator [bacterium]